ncbi:hypothetical protein [Geomicrobium sp. JCM 19038]|uniref:hypothetical protein n=1 Tax=Geomicrobium sp. JCM 19038 TaxID=1460635 RepID=UPI00045F403D|nr:hypothetical protein [Geomicrobium sp. JCM 19038]GAK06799.1 hypothetical protein JCM19038_508 [Geomicrobium sp. JCM 19038]
MAKFSKSEMICLLADLCGVPKKFLETMDDEGVHKLFHERLNVQRPYTIVEKHKKSS